MIASDLLSLAEIAILARVTTGPLFAYSASRTRKRKTGLTTSRSYPVELCMSIVEVAATLGRVIDNTRLF